MTRILRVEARPDDDRAMAREVLTLSAILAVALGLVALVQRLS